MTQRLFQGFCLTAIFCLVLVVPVAAEDTTQGGLDHVKTIFVSPMKDRLEHFLTNEIVRWGQFQVTLNPHEADAVLSDTTEISVKELLEDPPRIRRTRAKTRGTAFLVEMKTERVLWSAAIKPSDSFWFGGEKSNRELAQQIVGLLRKDIQPK